MYILALVFPIVASQLVLQPIDTCVELKTTLDWTDSMLHVYSLHSLSTIVTDYRKQLHQQYAQWCIEDEYLTLEGDKVYDFDS
jgi:hypothetical protein